MLVGYAKATLNYQTLTLQGPMYVGVKCDSVLAKEKEESLLRMRVGCRRLSLLIKKNPGKKKE